MQLFALHMLRKLLYLFCTKLKKPNGVGFGFKKERLASLGRNFERSSCPEGGTAAG
jgi:hypothetical protein